MNFYKLHIGDYAKKTGHLTVMEHGAYLLMLSAYYGLEKPLPPGEPLYRMLRANTKAERAAVDSIAAQFWKQTERGLVNGRAFEELESASKLIETAKQNGTRGGRPKKPSGLSEENPVGLISEPGGKAIQTPDSNSHYPISSKTGEDPKPQKPDHASEVFEHWKLEWSHPEAKLDPKRRARIEARLRSFSVADVCKSISGFKNSPFHTGRDPKADGRIFDKIETLLREDSQVEEGIRLFDNPPRALSKAELLQDSNISNSLDWLNQRAS